MSKLSFRARALDSSKPLPVYYAREVPDLSDYQAINRTVPQMPTGMEKEEETERHLQEVILAQQTNCHQDVFIPIPEATITVHHYGHIYHKLTDKSAQYIRVPGLGLEEEVPDYDLDSEDEEWLNAQTKERPLSPIHFERMMDKLEKGSGNTVLSVREAQSLLKDEEDLVLAVYDYWLAKRLRLGRPLIPTVKHERRDGSSSNNPYLAFRKRTEKMQTRKNRKNDETAYMQMLKLKRDLAKAQSLAQYITDRETKKYELSKGEAEIFKKRYLLEDWSGSIMSSMRPVSTLSGAHRHPSLVGDGWETSRTGIIKLEGDEVHMVGRQPVLVSSGLKRKSKKKKFYFPPGTPEPEPIIPITPEKIIKEAPRDLAVQKSEEDDPDGMFTFRRKPHVHYHKVLTSEETGWDLANGIPLGRRGSWNRYKFSRTLFGGYDVGNARRRVGRGGRVLWDRILRSDSESDEETTQVVEDKENESSTSNYTHKRCRFVSRSPSPSSNFEFQSFPHIISTDPSAPPSDHSAGMAIFEFAGFTSDSELPEDASSFSSLPTSQFSLKPSSSDLECDSSLQEDEKMEISAPGMADSAPRQEAAPKPLATSARVSASPFADRTTPSPAGASLNAVAASRPVSVTPSLKSKSSSTASLEDSRLPHKQQHITNHTLPSTNTTSPSSHPPSSVPLSSSSSSTLQRPSQPQSTEASRSSLSVTDSKRIVLSNSSRLPPSRPSLSSPLGPVGHLQQQAQLKSNQQAGVKAVAGSLVPATQQTPHTPSTTSTNTPAATATDSNLKSDRKVASNGPMPNVDSKPLSDKPLLAVKMEPKTVDSLEPEPGAWLVDGPPANILLLSTRTGPLKNFSQNNCKLSSLSDAAMAITSQFLQNSIKEEPSGLVRPPEPQLPVPLQVARAIPLAPSREIHLSVAQGTVPMTSSRLPTPLPPSSQVAQKLDGFSPMLDKRPVAAQSMVSRRTSTNGTSYPELFHRRLSENTERGLKQALTGSVMNHSSLLDSSTNSIVQPRAKPSEVT